MRRVVVTGIGMCSPLGYGVEHSWSQLIDSKSGIRQLTGFDITGLTSQVGGQIPEEGNQEFFPEKVIEIKEEKKKWSLLLSLHLLLYAKEAIQDSGWKPAREIDSERTGVMIGSGIGGLDGIKKAQKILSEVLEKFLLFLYPPA